MNKKEEIFTIGDKTNNGTISKFEVDSNGIRVFFEEKPKNYHVSLNSIKHVKQPLFTTEDGVDIFEGDKYFICTASLSNCINNDWKVFAHYTDLQNKVKSWGIKPVFSTKEKAEEYILMNKPCLSLKEIYDLTNKNSGLYNESDLEKLVKQKLKSC